MACYDSYISTDIPWIGEIPSHWRVMRGKTILSLLSRPATENDEIITCFRDGEVTLRKNRREDGFTVSLQEIGYQGIEPGDLVVHGMDGFAGAIGISDSRGKTTPVLNVMDSSENKRFIMYYLRAAAYKDVFMSLSTGIRVRSCDLRWNKLSVFPFVLPTKEEQAQIVAFLDHKLEELNNMIKEAKASIEEYKDWKASIIYEAITKGIEPDGETRSTESKWFPRLSVGTTVSRVGLHYDIILGKMLCPEQVDASYTLEPYFCAANVHFSGIDTENLKEMWFNSKEKEIYKVKQGDLLVVEGGAGAGGSAIVTDYNRETYVQNSIMIVRGRRGNSNGFLKYLLECLVGREYVDYACNKATIPHFTKEKLGNTPYPVFSSDTQKRIVEYLDERCNAIDALIGEKEDLISDLEAYKKSLIFEVVTGKRRVC